MAVTDYSKPGLNSTIIHKEHLGILDFLRGFAAISVMLFHFTGGPVTPHHHDTGGVLVKLFSPSLQSLFLWGNKGVQVFFVISGFIIPYSLWNSKYKINYFFSYMLKRVLRICPPAYINILLIIMQWLIIDYFIHHNSERLSGLTAEVLIRNLSFSYGFGDLHWVNGVFWTLGIEFQFYIIIGLLFNELFNNKFVVTLAVFVMLSAASYLPWHTNYHSYNSLFAIGGVTLLYYKQRIKLLPFLISIALFFAIICVINSVEEAAFGLGTALAIAFVKLKNPIFTFFGKISFSLYLTHVLVGSTMEFLLTKFLKPTTELHQILGIAIISVIACAVAYVYYLFVEKPTIFLVKSIKTM